jgi:hypothetical protein
MILTQCFIKANTLIRNEAKIALTKPKAPKRGHVFRPRHLAILESNLTEH